MKHEKENRKPSQKTSALLRAYYDAMSTHFGPTRWWPGDTPFEIAIGAILTQNTAWSNVEKAIENLKKHKLLTPRALLDRPEAEVEQALVPSGYFRVKTKRVRAFCQHLVQHYRGNMRRLAARPLEALRAELLGINGIGPETADDILLYACGHTVFVVDAYTRRIFSRHGVVEESVGYEALRAFFERHVTPDWYVYKEFHGLIVWTGKEFCRRTPRCAVCPLNRCGPKRPVLERLG